MLDTALLVAARWLSAVAQQVTSAVPRTPVGLVAPLVAADIAVDSTVPVADAAGRHILLVVVAGYPAKIH